MKKANPRLTVKTAGIAFLALAFTFWGFSAASAITIDLFDWAFNDNGVTYEYSLGDSPGDLPGYFDTSGFDWTTGLGTLGVTYGAPGDYFLLSFFDHEIDETINGFSNEYGDVSGTPAAGQSWEIDEPGYVFGDIYDNVVTFGSLDNTNGVPSGLEDDVSMAMGWNFSLLAGQTAEIWFEISETAPTASFYLAHTDPESPGSIYLSSTLNITGGGPGPGPGPGAIPEPGTLLLVGTGLAGFFMLRKRKSGKEK